MSQTSNVNMLPTEDHIAELVQCLKDLLSELETLTKCQKMTYDTLNSTADSINERNTPKSIPVTIATALAACDVLPYTAGTLVLASAIAGLTAGEIWIFCREWLQRRELKKELQGCKCHSTAGNIKVLQEKWKFLMENISIIFPGLDNDMIVGMEDMISIPHITQSPFKDTVRSRTANASMGLLGLLANIDRSINKRDEQGRLIREITVLVDPITDFEKIKKFIFNLPTEEGKNLGKIANEIKQKLEKNMPILNSIKEHPGNPYTTEGVVYLIKKSNIFNWSLGFDDKSDSFDVVLCFDGKPLYRLKPGGEERAVGPTEARADVLPIQDMRISNDEEKGKACNIIKALFDLKAEDTEDCYRFQDWLDTTLAEGDTVIYRNLRQTLNKIETLRNGRHPSRGVKTQSHNERLPGVEPLRRRQVQPTSTLSV